MRMADGAEPDGIKYSCYLQPNSEREMLAKVEHPDGRKAEERWRLDFVPRIGFDVADVQRGEEILDRMINELRG